MTGRPIWTVLVFLKEERDKIAEVVFQSNTWNERDRSSETEQYYVDQMVKAAPGVRKGYPGGNAPF